MSRSRSDDLLEAWKMVAQHAQRPVEAPRPRTHRGAGALSLIAAGGVAVVLIVALAIRGGGPGPQPSQPAVGASPSGGALASPKASTENATPRPSPSNQPSSASSAAPTLSYASAASLIDEYTSDLVHGDYASAWGLLAANGPTRAQSFADWSSERSQFFKSVAGRYTVTQPAAGTAPIADWLAQPWGASIDQARAVLIEVDYPALAGNNAGYDLYIVNPTPSGLEIYDVR